MTNAALLLVLKGLQKTQSLMSLSRSTKPDENQHAEREGGPEPREKPRKLRSESSAGESTKPQEEDPQLFQFDFNYVPPDYDKPLEVIREGGTATNGNGLTRRKSTTARHIEPFEYPKDIQPHEGPNRGDPLEDGVYVPHHRRKEREERRIQVQERDKLFLEAEKFDSQLKELQAPTWEKSLPLITAIDDVSDRNEMEVKRKLTVAEISAQLARYHDWKKRQLELKRNRTLENRQMEDKKEGKKEDKSSKRKNASLSSSSSKPAKPAKAQKVKKDQTPNGATSEPPAVKEEDGEPKVQIKRIKVIPPKKPEFRSFFDPVQPSRPRFDVLTKRNVRGDLWAFGQPIPHQMLEMFDIPDEWKSRHFQA
ncbi:hypothetical protein TRVA0_041S00584 [Trichomonascus vanleenenianus]|uniref:something about silencing 4 family protein n=1 Tax=Trichomonascus vanleenenianus TaxID=2268995 RepID=UPI003EC9683F